MNKFLSIILGAAALFAITGAPAQASTPESATQVVATQAAAPQVATPEVATPEVATPEVAAPQVATAVTAIFSQQDAVVPVAMAATILPQFGPTRMCRTSRSWACMVTPFYTPWCWKPC